MTDNVNYQEKIASIQALKNPTPEQRKEMGDAMRKWEQRLLGGVGPIGPDKSDNKVKIIRNFLYCKHQPLINLYQAHPIECGDENLRGEESYYIFFSRDVRWRFRYNHDRDYIYNCIIERLEGGA